MFNDPYDSFFYVNREKFEYRKKEEKLAVEIDELKLKMKKNLKVICFSQEPLSTLMWAHYADYHRGFSLMFETEKLRRAPVYTKNGNKIGKTRLIKVDYSNTQPDLGPYFQIKMSEKDWEKMVSDVIKIKSMDWLDENEWRIIPERLNTCMRNEKLYLKIRPSAVFLGSMMPAEHRKYLIRAAKKKGITVYEVCMDDSKNEFGLVAKKMC